MPAEIGNDAIRILMGPAEVGGPVHPPDDLAAEVVSFIRGARETLDVAVQELEDEEITLALCRASASGVRVRVILERLYLGLSGGERARPDPFADVGLHNSMNRRMLGALLASGIEVTVDLNPETFHQKYVVRDRYGDSSRAGVLTGSANFTPTGLHANLNHVVVLRGKRIAELYQEEFDEMWSGTFGALRTREDRSPAIRTIGGVPVKVLFAPDHAPEMEIMKQILKAQERVDFAIFTFADSSGVDDTLRAVAAGGVQVRGVLDRLQANQRWAATHGLVGRPNITLRQSTQDHGVRKLHHKLMVLDRQVVIAGSFNYTEPATRLNDENIIVIGDLEALAGVDPRDAAARRRAEECVARQRVLAAYALDEIDRIDAHNSEPLVAAG